MKKKGDISMNTIVVAAIALTVLVVLIYIFTGRSRLFVSGSKNCVSSHKGTCMQMKNCDGVTYPGTDCEDQYKDGYTQEQIQQLKNDKEYVMCCVELFDNAPP